MSDLPGPGTGSGPDEARRPDADAPPTVPAAAASTPEDPWKTWVPGVPADEPAPAPLQEGSQFGRYRILRLLGCGGMGAVYLAHDTLLDRPVALKVPRPEIASSPAALERFHREARLPAPLRHPNICPVHDVGTCAGIPYLTMAYIEGQPLAALLDRFRDPAEAAGLVVRVALALEEAHRQGVVHRDLKPSNILMDVRGEPVVTDFGLARPVHAGAGGRTSHGAVLGTPAYMPPEQAAGRSEAVGPCSDVYSLGVVLYELLTGAVPFDGTPTEILVQVMRDEPAPPSARRPGLDPRLEAVCLKALAKDPTRRYPSMAAFAEALMPWQGGPADPDHALPGVRHEQESHLAAFGGREALLRDVQAWVDAPGPGSYLLLLGPPGQGKSAFVAEWARREGQRGGCLLHMIKSHRNPLRFVPALLTQAAGLARVRFGAAAYEGDIDDLRNSLVRALGEVRARTGRAVVLLDALDELEGPDRRLGFLPEVLPDGVRVVLTCRPDIPLVQALRARLTNLHERALPPLAPEDLPLVLERRFGAASVRALQGSVDWPALFQRLQGNPLLLRRALDHLARALAAGPGPPDLSALPTTLDDLFRDVCDEIAGKKGGGPGTAEGRLRSRLLHFLCLAREPLGTEELSGLAAAGGQPLTPEECRDHLLAFSQYLLETRPGRYKPWHQGLTDHVRAHVLGAEGCREVEAVLCRWLDGPGGGDYARRHLVDHLAAARHFDRVGACLFDLRRLEARVADGGIFDLAHDFAEVLRQMPPEHPYARPLTLLDQALRADLHFLARHPECLFQCLWNRCWWYDCPEAADHYDPPEGGWGPEGPPWGRGGRMARAARRLFGWLHPRRPRPDRPFRLCRLLEWWRAEKEARTPGFLWVRALRPPSVPLGTAQRATLRGHHSAVNAICFSPDGQLLASASSGGTVRVWERHTGRELRCLPHNGPAWAVAFAPDGQRLASGAGEGAAWPEWMRQREDVPMVGDWVVRVWGLNGQVLACCRGHQGPVRAVAFSPDGRLLASGADDATVRLWDARGDEVLRLLGHRGRVCGVAFAPDGRLLASGSDDATVRVCEVDGGKEVTCVSLGGPVLGVAFAPDGTLLAAAADGSVWTGDAQRGLAAECPGDPACPVLGVAFAADGRHVARIDRWGVIRVWDRQGQAATVRTHETNVAALAFAPEGRQLASAARGAAIRLWDTRGRDRPRLRGHEHQVVALVFTDGGQGILSHSGGPLFHSWRTDSGVFGHAFKGSVPLAAGACGAVHAEAASWRAVWSGPETVILSDDEAVAWYSIALFRVWPQPGGRIWAGIDRDGRLRLIRLEGVR